MAEDVAQEAQAAGGYYVCTFPSTPAPIACAWEEFADSSSIACPNSNFLKGVKWSPDGSCCLTVSDDNWLRVFDLPTDAWQNDQTQLQEQIYTTAGTAAEQQAPATADAAASTPWRSGLQVHAGETVYDYCWFNGMSAADPVSCCFASTSRGQPVKIWDACSGDLRATYRAYDDADEITAATSVAFTPDGAQLVAGYNKCIRVFNVARPGRDCRRIPTYRKKQEGSIPGIISCLCFSPVSHDLMAAGSYSRCIGLFDARTYEQLLLLEGHRGGITQVSFSPDGNFLYTGARQDDQIHCWDIRNTGQVVYSMARDTGSTNQRIGFSIEPCGRHLATGGCDGYVRVFDLCTGQQVDCFQAASDTINGVDFSPCLCLLVTASGHRRYPLLPADGWEDTAAAGDVVTAAVETGEDRDHVSPEEGGTSAGGPVKRQRLDPDGQQQQGQKPLEQEQQGTQHQHHVHDVAGLSLASWKPGGMCNSLRLWRLQSQWVAAAAAAAAEAVEGGTEAHEAAEETSILAKSMVWSMESMQTCESD